MFEKAREFMRRRMRQIQAERAGRVSNPGRMETVFYGDHVLEFATGAVTIQKRRVDPDTGAVLGPWQTVHFDPNLIVTQAEGRMAQMAIGAANSALNYIELGDPGPTATPPQLTDTQLEQTTAERKAVGLTASGNIVTAEATFGTGDANGFTFTEAGLFTGPFAGGVMFARKTFSGIFKTAAFEMRFTWLITFLVQTQGGDCAGIALTGRVLSHGELWPIGGATVILNSGRRTVTGPGGRYGFEGEVGIGQRKTVNTLRWKSVNRLCLGSGRGGPIRTGGPLHPLLRSSCRSQGRLGELIVGLVVIPNIRP